MMAHSGKMQFPLGYIFPYSGSYFGSLVFSSFPAPLVFHPVECSYCHSESMMGFRYRCQQCHNYQLCQDCFWRGHAGGSHSNQHQMKEYTSWVRQGPDNTQIWMCECCPECKEISKMVTELRRKLTL